jgi:DNA repair exonuclease SbcCD ATPase subunit
LQSITSSKLIIGAFNLVAKIINGITTVLEGMGGLTKPLFIIISGVLILRNLFDKIKNIMLSFNTDDRAAKEREMIILTQQHKKEAAELLLKQQALAEEKGRGLKEEEKKLKEEKKKLVEEKKRIDEAIKAEKARIEQEMKENPGMKEADFESSLPGLEAELASINAAIKEKELERKTVSESRKAVEKEIKDLTDERKTLLNDINENEEEYQAAVGDSISSAHALNSEYIRRLELKRSLLDAEIQLLEARKSEALAKGDLASAAGIEKQLLSLANKRERLTKNINKLEGRNKKLLEGTASVYEKIGSILSAKIGMAIDGIASKFGVIGELVGGILKQMVI